MAMRFEPPTRQYYRVQSGPCWVALAVWRKRRHEVDDLCYEFARSVGGAGFYAGHDDNVGNALALNAVAFDGDLPKGWKPRRWKSLVRADGKAPAWPDQRTSAGKDALKAIKALPLRPSSGHVCKAIGHPQALAYSGTGTSRGCSSLGLWDTMTVGWHEDTFYVGLPRLNEEIAAYQAKGYTVDTPEWHPLPGMEPILKEEMELGFARARLEREKKAS